MASQSDMHRLTNRPLPLESIGNSLGGTYVNIGDGMGGAYVKNSSDLSTPFLGQNSPFPPLLSPKHEIQFQGTQNTPSFIESAQRFSLGFQNKKKNK